jgi:hypothetical protein
MASLPHAGVFSRKSVSLIVLHGSNDTSFLADKADAIKYIMLVRAIADYVLTARGFYLHAKVTLRRENVLARFYNC